MDFNIKKKITGYKSYKRITHMELFKFITYDFYKDLGGGAFLMFCKLFSAEPIYSLTELTKLYQVYYSLLSFGLAFCEPSNSGLFNKP